jgi:hypothetical protein
MNKQEANALMHQIHFFNAQFHNSENQPDLKDFHELMRISKDRCQLMLLKFASPDLIWVKKATDTLGGEYVIGMVNHTNETDGFHIPLSTLQQNLSTEQLQAWQIG